MALKKVYFLSDLHLGASYFADPRAKERAVVQWLDSIKNTAAEIYLLGDILDYWYEYRTVVPRGYVRFLGKLAELSDAGVKLHWFIGNHDIWIFDYLPSEIGVEVIDGSVEREIMGKRFFLAHGDGVFGGLQEPLIALQLVQRCLDRRLLVGWYLVAKLLELLLCLEDHGVSLVELVNSLTLLLVGLGVSLCLCLHLLYLVVAKT